ncbi:MAG: DNA primase family protein [Thermoplasmata archaeon]
MNQTVDPANATTDERGLPPPTEEPMSDLVVSPDFIALLAEEIVLGPDALAVPINTRKALHEPTGPIGRLIVEIRQEVINLMDSGATLAAAADSVARRLLKKSPSARLIGAYLPLNNRTLEAEAVASGRPLWVADEKGREKPDRAAFVDAAMARFSIAAIQDNEELLIYRDGQYVTGAQPILKGWVEAQFRQRGETASFGFVTETIAAIGRRTYITRKEFNPAGLVCLANGILDLTDPTKPVLRSHDPTVRFTAKIPAVYDPSTTCPTFDRFLVEVLPFEPDRTEVRKMFGYCLRPGNPLQIAFMFIGEGANGKSTLLGVLCALLGEDNVTAETLQSLVTNRFATAKLWGKRANICADIPANPLSFTGTLKTLTGGDLARAENKFGHPFYFVNDAKLIFSANELPEVTDRTRAFWRRWFMVRFTETFIGKEDRKLSEKLKAELSGILNYALLGLADLAEDGEFKPTQSSEALALEWKQRADPVYWFVSTKVEKDPGAWIAKEDLYEAYVQFCETHGASPRKPEVFGKLLPNHAPWARTERKTIGAKGAVRGWQGLRVRPELDPEEPSRPSAPISTPRDLTGWAGKTGSPTSIPGLEPTQNGVDIRIPVEIGPGAEVELPAQPAQPVNPPLILTGWAGKTGSPASIPGQEAMPLDPTNPFQSGLTRTDLAKVASSASSPTEDSMDEPPRGNPGAPH